MTILLYLLLIVGVLTLIFNASQAYVIAKVNIFNAERRIHFAHHIIHSVCGLLTIVAALAKLTGGCQTIITISCALACLILSIDAICYIICNRIYHFTIRRDAIRKKWDGEKVFGPEHDGEVSEYRVLREITQKDLLRDSLYIAIFVILFLI